MYLTFYGLSEKPFSTTPDPRFLYLTPGHREALAQLEYGVQEGAGFLVLTGEVGTGKTTLLQALMQRLDGQANVAFVTNSALPFDGLLEYVLQDFGVPEPGDSPAQRLVALNRFLIERCRAGQNPVLIIDEAHHLDPTALERIRLLSNFETPAQKLLQILLVGQPELGTRLGLPELRQLKQRIGLRSVISPLTPQETWEYIRRRLRVAGASDLALFTDRAVRRIARYARGIPRVVNIVCDHSLVIGYGDRQRRIDADIVRRAIRYLEDGTRPRGKSAGWPRWLAPRRFAGAALAVSVLAAVTVPAASWKPLGNVSAIVATFVATLARSVRELLGP